jgi:hypothetical protein
VTGESPIIDTKSTQVAGNVNPTQMQEVPLLGRNWLELAKMVPGMTSNVINTTNPGVSANNWAMNLDGQAVANKTSQGLGQPKFSREAIAEYQMYTRHDVTQGGSTARSCRPPSLEPTRHPAAPTASSATQRTRRTRNTVLQPRRSGGRHSGRRFSRTNCTTSFRTRVSGRR